MDEKRRGEALALVDAIGSFLLAAGFGWELLAGWDSMPFGVATVFAVASAWVAVRYLAALARRLRSRRNRP